MIGAPTEAYKGFLNIPARVAYGSMRNAAVGSEIRREEIYYYEVSEVY